MKQFPDTFCICGLGPFTVDRHGIYDEDRTMYDCPRCEQEIPRTDPGRDATVEYYRGLLREAEQQNDAARLQEENRKLREALVLVAQFDRTETYSYHGRKALDPAGRKPDAGSRWNTPREIARAALEDVGETGEGRDQ
jgi:hypothetical protein